MSPSRPRRCTHKFLDAYLAKYKPVGIPTPKTTTGKPSPRWHDDLPHPNDLRRKGFGPPDSDHSVTQEGSFETVLCLVLKSDFLDEASALALFATNPLVQHLAYTICTLSDYDFRWLRDADTNWASQTSISPERRKAMMACLLHYDLDVSLLFRFLGGNYTGAHRDVHTTAKLLLRHGIDDYLVRDYIRVMTVGCPRTMNADISRTNALQYWRAGNNPSIDQNLGDVLKTMNKEERNNFVIPLSSWLWRFVPHLFITPNHYLVLPGKKPRLIFDAKFQHTAESISINMMTADASKTELACDFGLVKLRLYTRIYNLRITHPTLDIAIHANDVKSCFRQLKHHPDVLGGFAFIIGQLLLLPTGLTFGSDFSPASWETLRRIIEKLAQSLFSDSSLRTKHRKYLDRIQWQRSLGSKKAKFTPATPCDFNKGVRTASGSDENTQHDMFVDDMIYADIFEYDRVRLEQAAAASIEAIFITLGESELWLRQDPISFDKFEELVMAWLNRVIGVEIDTRRLAARTPVEYVDATVNLLSSTWHASRFTFSVLEAETLTGRLGYIAETAPWLRFMMSHLHTSIARALKANNIHLIRTRRDFRRLLQTAKATSLSDLDTRRSRFAASQAAKALHHSRVTHRITVPMRRKLNLIRTALSSDWISMWRPLGHFVKRSPSAIGDSDSSLHAAGGYSFDMGYWWYLEWPEAIRRSTLKFVYSDEHGNLVSINALEYASLLINFVAASYVLTVVSPSRGDPHPVVLLRADNRSSESWLIKASKSSQAGRALGYIQCALLINNPVGINVTHVTSEQNEIADRISRIESEAALLAEMKPIYQAHPSLAYCQRFHPSAELKSLILDTLLTKNFIDPLTLSRRALASPGRITS